jgi:death-on-curing protein
MDVVYLSVDQVVELQAEAIDNFGGSHGLRSIELLESAVFLPQQSAFGADAYLSISSKAAAYAYFLAKNHAFIDGNKRTAALAMLMFLDLNGYRLDCSDEDFEEAIVAVAAGDVDKDKFFDWIERWSKPADDDDDGNGDDEFIDDESL